VNRTIQSHRDFYWNVAQRKPKFREENQWFPYGRIGKRFFSAPHMDAILKAIISSTAMPQFL